VVGAKRAILGFDFTGKMTDEAGEPRPLDDLDARLRAARAGSEVGQQGPAQDGAGMGAGAGIGVRIGVELVAGIGVGALIGYGLDSWLGTRPWLMVVFFFLGAAASVVNMYRVVKGLDDSVGLGQAKRRKDGK
jgi:ATP synthase protein I